MDKVCATDVVNARILYGNSRADKGYIGLWLHSRAILDIISGPMMDGICLPVDVAERVIELKRGFSVCRHLFGGPQKQWTWVGWAPWGPYGRPTCA